MQWENTSGWRAASEQGTQRETKGRKLLLVGRFSKGARIAKRKLRNPEECLRPPWVPGVGLKIFLSLPVPTLPCALR